MTRLPAALVTLLLSLQSITALPVVGLAGRSVDSTQKNVAWQNAFGGQALDSGVNLIAYYPTIVIPDSSTVWQQGETVTIQCEWTVATQGSGKSSEPDSMTTLDVVIPSLSPQAPLSGSLNAIRVTAISLFARNSQTRHDARAQNTKLGPRV